MTAQTNPIDMKSEISNLAKELQHLADTGQYEKLAKMFPPMEVLADMLEFIMKYPGMPKKFEEHVLKGGE